MMRIENVEPELMEERAKEKKYIDAMEYVQNGSVFSEMIKI